MASSRWNLFKLHDYIKDHESAVNWAISVGLIPSKKYCKKHKKEMIVEDGYNLGFFLCKKKGKRHRVARAENTWFENCHTSIPACILITYCFAYEYSYRLTIHESSIIEDATISRESVADRFSFAREVCMLALDKEYEQAGKIGGAGCVVEIDETKIGKRKYERGRVVEGSWVLGMIERGSVNYRLEICPNNVRDETTLVQLIKKHVANGTTIMTDCWRGYINLEHHGYTHKTVNHTENFVDPSTGAHTQNIECSWRHLKTRLTRGGVRKENLDLHMCEFLWRRKVVKDGKDPFTAFIDDIKEIYNGA